MSTPSLHEQFESLKKEDLPNHLAIIPNGHRTWAKRNGKSATEAHKKGMEVLIELSRFLREIGIHTATVWAMSTDNYKKRSLTEVKGLMSLLKIALNQFAQEFYENEARIIHLGVKDHLPEDLRDLLTQWEEKSKNNTKFCANIAFDYGGHDEILRAMKKAFKDVTAGKLPLESLDEEIFKDYLDTKDQLYPYPDLIIRTAGEMRLSGFMPWQSVYSEIYSTPELMPEVTIETLKRALVDYAGRKRTFGGDLTTLAV